MTMLVNLAGEILPAQQARVSVLDRGFLYGDSVYEVLRTYGGRPFALAEHLERLGRSARRLQIELPARAWLLEQLERTLAAAGNRESYIRIVVTRGPGPLTLDPSGAESPLALILVDELKPFPEWMYRQGIALYIPATRRNHPASLDPAIKSGNYLNSILALAEARRAGFDDALMLGVDGRVAEATTANVFAWQDDRLLTPPLATGILEGVTRRLVLQLAAAAGLTVQERDLWPEQLSQVGEVMLTSTLREVMPVVRVGERVIGNGRPGPQAARLRRLLVAHARAAAG